MTIILTKKKLGSVNYYQKGFNPVLFLMSGTHGDEYGVIEPLRQVIDKYSDQLPDFIFIPEVSPSAIKLKTRNNRLGHDTNRKFYENSDDPEARAVMDIVRQFNFKLGISFHEDVYIDTFYLYDSEKLDLITLSMLENKIKGLGIGLYSGIDDSNDATLGNVINEGYITIPGDSSRIIQGDFWDWSLSGDYVKRLLYPEIPGKMPVNLKERLIEIIFTNLIFRLL